MCLPVSHPKGIGVSARHRCGPKQEDIDSPVGSPFVPHGKGRRPRSPRWRPRAGARLQQGDNAGCDLLVNIDPVGLCAAGCVPCHVLVSLPKDEAEGAGVIGFCLLAKRVGEWRNGGADRGGGGSPALHKRSAEGRGHPRDHQARPLAAETAWPLRQGAGTGPGIPANNAADLSAAIAIIGRVAGE
jgi:hypothetical protein